MARFADFSDTKQAPIAQSTESTSSSQTPRETHPSYGSYDDHPFKDAATAQYWRDVYENAHYEGRHHFDPSYTWTAEEEKRLVRRVSSIITVWIVRRYAFETYTYLARFSYHILGMDHVLRTGVEPQEYQSSDLRQHVEGPRYALSLVTSSQCLQNQT
jgi:hypothetical protein